MAVRRQRSIPGILALALIPALLGAAQTTRPLLPSGQEEISIPFEAGEEVRYEVNWKPLQGLLPFSIRAGELRFTVSRSHYQEADTFKISAWASSDGMLASLLNLEVRDYYESWIDRQTLKSYRFLYQKRQNNRQRDLEILFDYPGDRTVIRETDVASSPPREIRHEILPGIPAPLVDTLSVFYAARWRDFKPGEEYRIHLSDNGRIKEVDVRIEKAETIKIDMGRFDTLRVQARGEIFRGGGNFKIWYTTDELRLPVKFEAEVKIGKVYGQLIQLQTPQLTRQRIRVQ